MFLTHATLESKYEYGYVKEQKNIINHEVLFDQITYDFSLSFRIMYINVQFYTDLLVH